MKKWFGFAGVLLFVAAVLLGAAPVQAEEADSAARFIASLQAPAPSLLAIVWPAPGEACYGCNSNPNCIWTCSNGSHGSSNVASEPACRSACKAACPGSPCWLI